MKSACPWFCLFKNEEPGNMQLVVEEITADGNFVGDCSLIVKD